MKRLSNEHFGIGFLSVINYQMNTLDIGGYKNLRFLVVGGLTEQVYVIKIILLMHHA